MCDFSICNMFIVLILPFKINSLGTIKNFKDKNRDKKYCSISKIVTKI